LILKKNGCPSDAPAPSAVQWEAEWSEDSATRETEGAHDEFREGGGHTTALTPALLGDRMEIHSSTP